MTSTESFDEGIRFYVGHHDPKRTIEVNRDIFQHVQDLNYDMLTAPITNDAFHSKVLQVLSDHIGALNESETPLLSIAGQADVPAQPILPSLTPADTLLGPDEAIGQLILTTSTWIDLASPDPLIAEISRQVLALEISYASFCGATNVLIQGPAPNDSSQDGLAQYSHALVEVMGLANYLQFHIAMPMTGQPNTDHAIGDLASLARDEYVDDLGLDDDDDEDEENEEETQEVDDFASWDVWNVIRSTCRYSPRVSVALTIPKNLPPSAVQSRWFSEPIRIINLPKDSFTSVGELPKLSKLQHSLIWQYMRLRPTPWILLSDTGSLPGLTNSSAQPCLDLADDFPSLTHRPHADQASSSKFSISHHHYLNHVREFQQNQPSRPIIEMFGAGYQDYLQNPLQPLADNLESITYEVFEKDPIKYEWYERATAAALKDWVATGKRGSGPHGRIVVAVTGAGRGPLVTRALEASQKTGVEIDMWLVEKNPNAFVLLQRHNANKWHNRVSLVHSDMRTWTGPVSSSGENYKIDILISELLGSLADNELSPECLDGVQHLLNPADGISIPSSYTAHVTPISAPKIHADILSRTAGGDDEAFSVPYVTMLHAIDFLSARPPQAQPRHSQSATQTLRSGAGGGMPDIPLTPVIREAWEFKHPIPTSHLPSPVARNPTSTGNEHNVRSTRLEFFCKDRGVCHGIAGYFEAVLYDPASILGPIDPSTSKAAERHEERKKIEISTNPLTMDAKSQDMISWFPMFLPLKQPLYFPDGSLLVVNMWRRTEGRSVWYEWQVESWKVEGKAGRRRRSRLGGSEVVSSKASACLM